MLSRGTEAVEEASESSQQRPGTALLSLPSPSDAPVAHHIGLLERGIDTMFDLYLYQGCEQTPALDALVEQVPLLADPEVMARIRQSWPRAFLGLEVPKDTAVVLLRRLEQAGARGQVLPAAYRTPTVSMEQAQAIAEVYIAQQIQEHLPTYTFDPVSFRGEGPRWWKFAAGSEQLQEEDIIPGAIFASVDKLDGHVWQTEEFERLFAEDERLRRPPPA